MARKSKKAPQNTSKVKFAPASKKQELFLKSQTYITLYGGAAGSGKSYTGLLRFLLYVEDPDFVGYVFRKNTTDMKGGGKIFDLACKMFQEYDSRVTYTQVPMEITFPSGATITFQGLDGKEGMAKIQGSQISAVMIDEATHFSFEMVDWILTRMRKATKSCVPNMWLTCNPDPDSFLCDWIKDFYLHPLGTYEDDVCIEGRPNRDLDGVVRYYLRFGDDFVWGDTKEELIEQNKHLANKDQDGNILLNPLTFCFISGTIHDNPPLMKADPQYLNTLINSSRINRERLYYGNWFARPESQGMFSRDWCEIVPCVPSGVKRRKVVRHYDLAGTLPSETDPDPDWTASVVISNCDDGYYYVEDARRMRDLHLRVMDEIEAVAKEDQKFYHNIHTYIPQDPNSSAKYATQQTILNLSRRGVGLKKTVNNKKNKGQRFEPFCAVAQEGLVKVVQGDWNNDYFKELEAFLPVRNFKGKDDQVDATSDAYEKVCSLKELPRAFGLHVHRR